MTRIYIYSILYFLCLGIYIFSGAEASYEGLIFFAFLISTLIFTFTRERLPSKDIQQYPEASRYKSNRVNIYTQGMIIMLGLLSFVFAFISQTKFLNPTVLVLIIWPIVIIGSYLLMRIHQKREWLYSLSDYINSKMGVNVSLELIAWIIENVKTEEDFSRVPEHIWVETHFLRETHAEIVNFINSTTKDITYQEIKAAEREMK